MTKPDKNISPEVAPSVYSVMEQIKKMGLTEDDVVTLVLRRVGASKITRTQVQITLKALERIEKNFMRANKP